MSNRREMLITNHPCRECMRVSYCDKAEGRTRCEKYVERLYKISALKKYIRKKNFVKVKIEGVDPHCFQVGTGPRLKPYKVMTRDGQVFIVRNDLVNNERFLWTDDIIDWNKWSEAFDKYEEKVSEMMRTYKENMEKAEKEYREQLCDGIKELNREYDSSNDMGAGTT